MRLVATLLAMIALLSACVTKEVQRETVVKEPPRVEVVPGPQGPPGPPGPQGATGPAGDTTIVVPR